ncbi:MAG: hypothetical protein QOF72_1547 [Blastocatellia bacterium]|jgi:hypothetical protein|nr:hypothetical protein [Blastocatellia bacterium]
MKSENFNLSKMTVEDLFRAKQERRQRLAALPFEQKIEIVRRLQSVSPMTQVGFYGLVHDDLLATISIDLGIQISRASPAMIPNYSRGQWLYDINQLTVTIRRWLTGKEASVQGFEDDFIPRLIFGAQLRAAVDSLKTDGDEPRPQFEIWQPEYRRRTLPISFLSFETANGTWIAEWFVEPILTQNSDFILFDIKFKQNIQTMAEKRLQVQIHMAALSKDSAKNLAMCRPYIMALLESAETFNSVTIQGAPDNPE